MNYSNHCELSIPLVGTLPQEVDCQDNEENTVDSIPDKAGHTNCHDTLMTVVLYILLFLQFGVVFYAQDDAVDGLRWPAVNIAICLYIVSTHLYRNALTKTTKNSSGAAMLIPEILIVAIMALVLFRQVVPALCLLVAGNLMLALTAVDVTSYRLRCGEDIEECSEDNIV
jgi:hypothetical protein